MDMVVERLLHSSEPSIRLRTLTEVLGESPKSDAVAKARTEVKHSQRVRLLLSERTKGVLPYHPYTKWTGAHWVLSVLADIGYPGKDPTLIPLREQVYNWLLSKDHLRYIPGHGLYVGPVIKTRGLVRAHASMEGNAVWYLNALGLADDRTRTLADNLVEWQWPDGGWNCDKNPGAHTSSFHESLLPLRGLALQSRDRGGSYREVVERAAEYFLERRLFRRKRDGGVISEKFTRLHYPAYWHYDILMGLRVMKETGFIRDERCANAISLLESKRLEDGGFPAEGTHYRSGRPGTGGRSLVSWGGASKVKMNEFVTCEALSVLARM
jgi:hypothetical protein